MANVRFHSAYAVQYQLAMTLIVSMRVHGLRRRYTAGVAGVARRIVYGPTGFLIVEQIFAHCGLGEVIYSDQYPETFPALDKKSSWD